MKTALLLIDIQMDYFSGGKMELNNSLSASRQTANLVQYFRKQSLPVIHVRHISTRPDASFFLPDTRGVEFHESVKPEKDEIVITKNYPSCFRSTELHELLKEKNISRLVTAGMMTHMCVDTSVRAAFDLGYECIVAADCCATKSLSFNGKEVPAENVQAAFLAALNGTFSKVMYAENIIKSI